MGNQKPSIREDEGSETKEVKCMLEDLNKLIECGNDESTGLVKTLAQKYNCSAEKIYWTVRSVYGKKLKDLRWDFREPTEKEFLRAVFLSGSSQELRKCFPYMSIEQWNGVYDRVLGVSTFSKAKERALIEMLPATSVPQSDNNEAMWAACRLGDGSYDAKRSSWRIEHCAWQANWLERKVEIFHKAFPQCATKITHNEKRNTYSWYSCKIGHGKFHEIGSVRKAEVVKHLNHFGIWWLFLDDGCYPGKGQQLISFAVENLEIGTRLIEKIKELSGIDFRVCHRNEIRVTGQENVIRFHKTFLEPFSNLTPACMRYKTTYVKI